MQNVPGLDPEGTPFERFKQFASMIAAVPKSEVENMTKKPGSAKNGTGTKKESRIPNGGRKRNGTNRD
jgi:hypothetical protein